MQNKNEQQPAPQQPVTYGPAPADPNTPYQQQPVNQQYFAQPQAAPVQYVVMAESLKGIKGWLLFFTVIFAIMGVSYITIFFTAMTNLGDATAIVNLIFAPFVAAASIVTTVFVAMQKKLAKWLAIGTLGIYALFGIVNVIVQFATNATGAAESAPVLISSILVALVLYGLWMLYFFVSKRVKETLVN